MTIFVSYARADLQNIQPVLSRLRDHGFELWIDEEGIEGASFWRKEIVEAIENCSVVLFFATDASCKSDAVTKELALANEEKKPILPVLLKAIKLPSDMRYQIVGIQHINLDNNYDNGINCILTSLSRITKIKTNILVNSEKFKKHHLFMSSIRIAARKFESIAVLSIAVISFTIFKIDALFPIFTFTAQPSLSPSIPSISKDKINSNFVSTQAIENKYSGNNKAGSIIAGKNLTLRALVIGNGKYNSRVELRNAENDAKDITKRLKSLGFIVTELINMPRNKLLFSIREHYTFLPIMHAATRNIVIELESDGSEGNPIENIVHIVYYSGHSVEIDGVQYLAPVDVNPGDLANYNYRNQLISIENVTPDKYGYKAENSFILYSAAPGGMAIDGDGTNSPFTKALIEGLNNRELDLSGIFTFVRRSVKENTNGIQTPWFSVSANQPIWLGQLEQSHTKGGASILVLDGCRNNPFLKKLR